MSRLPEFDPRELDDAQKNVYNIIVSGPRGKFGGPFYALIHAPGLADATQALGAALRFNTQLTPQYRETAILIAARFWRRQLSALTQWRWSAVIINFDIIQNRDVCLYPSR